MDFVSCAKIGKRTSYRQITMAIAMLESIAITKDETMWLLNQ